MSPFWRHLGLILGALGTLLGALGPQKCVPRGRLSWGKAYFFLALRQKWPKNQKITIFDRLEDHFGTLLAHFWGSPGPIWGAQDPPRGSQGPTANSQQPSTNIRHLATNNQQEMRDTSCSAIMDVEPFSCSFSGQLGAVWGYIRPTFFDTARIFPHLKQETQPGPAACAKRLNNYNYNYNTVSAPRGVKV